MESQIIFDSCWRRFEERNASRMRTPREIIWLNGAPGAGKVSRAPERVGRLPPADACPARPDAAARRRRYPLPRRLSWLPLPPLPQGANTGRILTTRGLTRSMTISSLLVRRRPSPAAAPAAAPPPQHSSRPPAAPPPQPSPPLRAMMPPARAARPHLAGPGLAPASPAHLRPCTPAPLRPCTELGARCQEGDGLWRDDQRRDRGRPAAGRGDERRRHQRGGRPGHGGGRLPAHRAAGARPLRRARAGAAGAARAAAGGAAPCLLPPAPTARRQPLPCWSLAPHTQPPALTTTATHHHHHHHHHPCRWTSSSCSTTSCRSCTTATWTRPSRAGSRGQPSRCARPPPGGLLLLLRRARRCAGWRPRGRPRLEAAAAAAAAAAVPPLWSPGAAGWAEVWLPWEASAMVATWPPAPHRRTRTHIPTPALRAAGGGAVRGRGDERAAPDGARQGGVAAQQARHGRRRRRLPVGRAARPARASDPAGPAPPARPAVGVVCVLGCWPGRVAEHEHPRPPAFRRQQRTTDISTDLCKKRYQVFKTHYRQAARADHAPPSQQLRRPRPLTRRCCPRPLQPPLQRRPWPRLPLGCSLTQHRPLHPRAAPSCASSSSSPSTS
jgi:hypothetical protein